MSSVDVDTRGDFYSLGVLLYEMLVGQMPFENKCLLKICFDEMRRAIREKGLPWSVSRLGTIGAGE